MRPTSTLILATLFLAACSSERGTSPIAGAVLERVKAIRSGGNDAQPQTPAAPPTGLTRAQIEEFNVALVRANLQGESVAPLMVARSVNQGYATYLSRAGQSITLRGALVTSTRGLGTDLLSVEHSADDPLTKLTLPSAWPKTTARTYFVPGTGLKGVPIGVFCEVKRVKDHDIELADTPFETTQMTEVCRTDSGVDFASHHFVDRNSGQVWVTQQWIGPDMAAIALEVLEPLD